MNNLWEQVPVHYVLNKPALELVINRGPTIYKLPEWWLARSHKERYGNILK